MERNILDSDTKTDEVDKNAGSNAGGEHTVEEKVQPEPDKGAMLLLFKKCSG